MAKAVFLDYFGTILQENGPDMQEFVKRCIDHSNASDPEKLRVWWMNNLHEMEETCFGDSYLTEEEICLRLLMKAEKEFGLRDDLNELKQMNISGWMYAPIFTDVKSFFEQCGKPVYIITNHSDRYVRVCLKRHGLHVNGIICGDMVKAYKPHRELFDKALEVAGVEPGDVVHIGDSIKADVEGARSAGITPILLDRKREVDTIDCRCVSTLNGALRSI